MADAKVAVEELKDKVARAMARASNEFVSGLSAVSDELDLLAKEMQEANAATEEARTRLKAIEEQCQERLRRHEKQLREKLDNAEAALRAKQAEIDKACRGLDEMYKSRAAEYERDVEAKNAALESLDRDIAAKEKHLQNVNAQIKEAINSITRLAG